jgi:hypothetical protein
MILAILQVGPNGVEWLGNADSLEAARAEYGTRILPPEDHLIAVTGTVIVSGD